VRTRRQQIGWGAAAVLLSAAALWHGTGLDPVWGLTWLAPWPVLAFALRASAPAAAGAALAAWALGGLNLWHYYRGILGVPLPVALAAIALPAIAFAALAVLMRVLARRGRTLLAVLALPAGWTALEHVVSRVSPHGTFGSLAYTQMDCLPVVQVAALLGISGITFLLVLVPGALAMATLPAAARDRGRIAWTTAAAVVLALAYGGWRLVPEDRALAAVTVGLAAADHPEQPAPAETDEGRRVIAQYARASEELAARGAQVIVLPETTLRATAAGVVALQGRFAGLSENRGVTVVLGVDRLDAGGEANTAIAFSPGRGQPAVYAKEHLLLPFERRFRAGRELTLVDSAAGPFGLAICKDLDFPALGRRYAGRGVSMLLVPAWDFTADGWLHSRMAVLRGVESGFAVARAARGGRLTISDDRGRIVAEAARAEAPVTSVLAQVRVGQAGTPYARLGDWFAWLAGGLFALALVTRIRAGSAPEVVKP
jgi:apolipoprotein N-acyltransferase